MTAEDYIKEAIQCAKESERQGGCAIGAVVVNVQGEVIGRGMSLAGVINDVAQHGEIAAIRDACQKLGTINLEGCSIYGSLESCGMCMSAALWANMDAVYFGAFAKDVTGNDYEYENYDSIERAKTSRRWDGSKIKVQGGILRDECKALLADYKDWAKVVS